MKSLPRGSGVLRIMDSTKTLLFSALLVGVRVTNDEDSLTLRVESIDDIIVNHVALGLETPNASPEPQQISLPFESKDSIF